MQTTKKENYDTINVSILSEKDWKQFVFDVDVYMKPYQCFKCKETIFWGTTKKWKKIPICKDEYNEWITHFDNCPYADEFRKK